jgi:N-methylhydantoinase B
MGKFCGGAGQDVLLESTSETPIAAVFLAERTRFAAPGLAGGQAGGLGDIQINERSVDTRKLHVLNHGDRLLLRTPGAGGYGEPQQRTDALRQLDRVAGLTDTSSAA